MAGPAGGAGRVRGRLVLVLLALAAIGLVVWQVIEARRGAADGGNASADGGTQAAEAPPLQPFLARADIARGQAYFQQRCSFCHTTDAGGPADIGPNLHGAMGGPIGRRPGYAYSAALAAQGGRWDWDKTNAFLSSPRAFAPGTRMTFAGTSDPQDRADVMVYMNAQGGTLGTPER